MDVRCVVPMCGNSTTNRRLTFQLFPKEPHLRKAWIKALGVKNLYINKTSRLCSEHFTEDSFYDTKDGRQLRASALPNVVLDPTVSASLMICRICLSHRRNMYRIGKCSEAFEQITGLSASEGDSSKLPQCLCWECAARLTTAASFRAKALISDGLLRNLLRSETCIKIRDIKTINTKDFGLKSSLVERHNDSNQFDYYIKDTFAGPYRTNLLQSNENTENGLDNIQDNDSTRVSSINKMNNNVPLYLEHNYSNIMENNNNNNKNNTTEEFDETIEMVETSELTETSEVDETSEVGETNELTNNWNIQVEKRSKTITIVPITVKRNKNNKQGLERKRSADVIPQTKVDSRTKELDSEYFDTIILSHEQQIFEVEKRQESSAYINAPFKCDVCYTGIKDEEVFKRHMLRHSDKAGTFECIICKVRKKTKNDLQKHSYLIHSKEYRCRKCEFVTRFRGVAQKHMDIHKGINSFKCDLCDIVFERGPSYRGHLRMYHLTDNVCELCGYTFLSKFGVKSHKSRQHILDEGKELIGPYCDTCDLKFLSEKAYDIHLRCSAKHLTGESDPTRISNVGGTAGRLIIKKYSAPRRIISSSRYKKQRHGPHKKITSSKKPYACEQCGEELPNYGAYTQHFTGAHPGQSRGQYPPEEMPWMCDLCGKMYRTKYSLDLHIDLHTGEKHFQCDYCGKKFSHKYTLSNHIKAQHLKKSADTKCMLCDKEFMSHKNLKKHLLVHFGEKPYACQWCPTRFISSDDYRSHVRHVHYKIPRSPKKRQKLNIDEE